MFLIVAIVARLLGFGGIVDVSVGIAQVLFVIFITLFLVAFIVGAVDRMRQR